MGPEHLKRYYGRGTARTSGWEALRSEFLAGSETTYRREGRRSRTACALPLPVF